MQAVRRWISATSAAIVATVAFAAATHAQDAAPPAAPAGVELTGDVGSHDPSRILKVDGRYYLFNTGRGVVAKQSADLKEWTDLDAVIGQVPEWAREVVPRFRGSYWAPEVIQVGDKYLLYFSVSSFGSQRSAIGLMTNATLNPEADNFKWEDQGIVIESERGDPYNAIDPAALIDDDGKLYLTWGSFWGGIYGRELDAATGKPLDAATPATHLAKNADSDEIEAAYLHKHDGKYYLFVSWGRCCRDVRRSVHSSIRTASRSPTAAARCSWKPPAGRLVRGIPAFLGRTASNISAITTTTAKTAAARSSTCGCSSGTPRAGRRRSRLNRAALPYDSHPEVCRRVLPEVTTGKILRQHSE
jgi:arabinan endo-1,5-alpha-L-arabinosidase